MLTPSEAGSLSHLLNAAKAGAPTLAGMLPKESIGSLHAAGLIRFGVPMSAPDRIAVPPLSGFVMNRVGNDYLEKVLYEMFVSNDEATTLGNLAALLGQSAELVMRAASIACRLGFAKKLTAPSLSAAPPTPGAADAPESRAAGTVGDGIRTDHWHETWATDAMADGPTRASVADADKDPALSPGDDTSHGAASGGAAEGQKRVALLVDSKLSACLMMSNLGPGPCADELKQHAVTLYEVGKIPHESLDAFLGAMAAIERPPIEEAEVLEYFDLALALRDAIRFLRSSAACEIDGQLRPLDVVRTESLAALDRTTRDRVLHRSYALLISMAPMVPAVEHIYTASLPVHHFGPSHPLQTSPWLLLALCQAMGRGARAAVLPRGSRLRALPRVLRGCSHILIVPWSGEQASGREP